MEIEDLCKPGNHLLQLALQMLRFRANFLAKTADKTEQP